MFVGTQVDIMFCKKADSVCCLLSCVFFSVFIMRKPECLAQGRRNARLDLALLHFAVHRTEVALGS